MTQTTEARGVTLDALIAAYVAEHGDGALKLQYLDDAITRISMKLEPDCDPVSFVTFGTEQAVEFGEPDEDGLTTAGLPLMGLVLWVDRDRYNALIEKLSAVQ